MKCLLLLQNIELQTKVIIIQGNSLFLELSTGTNPLNSWNLVSNPLKFSSNGLFPMGVLPKLFPKSTQYKINNNLQLTFLLQFFPIDRELFFPRIFFLLYFH